MSKNSKVKTYSVMVKAVLDFNIDVKAETLAQAVEEANKIDIKDVEANIPPDGCYNDFTISVQGVFVNE